LRYIISHLFAEAITDTTFSERLLTVSTVGLLV